MSIIRNFRVNTVVIEESSGEYKADGPDQIVKFWREKIETLDIFDPEKEILVVVALNTKLKIKGFNIVSMGSVNESLAHPREIFRPLIAIAAYAFVMMHHHPSGDCTPSSPDTNLTRRIRECGELLQIKLIDHIIVGSSERFSFRESGII